MKHFLTSTPCWPSAVLGRQSCTICWTSFRVQGMKRRGNGMDMEVVGREFLVRVRHLSTRSGIARPSCYFTSLVRSPLPRLQAWEKKWAGVVHQALVAVSSYIMARLYIAQDRYSRLPPCSAQALLIHHVALMIETDISNLFTRRSMTGGREMRPYFGKA